MLSSRPFLYPWSVDAIFDELTMKAGQIGAENVPELDILKVLADLRDYVGGLLIAVTIGNRSTVSTNAPQPDPAQLPEIGIRTYQRSKLASRLDCSISCVGVRR